jgi:hypothetical protein
LGLGKHLHLTFAEVRGPAEVGDLLKRYLKSKKEIDFAQLPDERARPGEDALLFERKNSCWEPLTFDLPVPDRGR